MPLLLSYHQREKRGSTQRLRRICLRCRQRRVQPGQAQKQRNLPLHLRPGQQLLLQELLAAKAQRELRPLQQQQQQQLNALQLVAATAVEQSCESMRPQPRPQERARREDAAAAALLEHLRPLVWSRRLRRTLQNEPLLKPQQLLVHLEELELMRQQGRQQHRGQQHRSCGTRRCGRRVACRCISTRCSLLSLRLRLRRHSKPHMWRCECRAPQRGAMSCSTRESTWRDLTARCMHSQAHRRDDQRTCARRI